TLKPPFDKKELRQAAQWAFDYKAMIDYYKGYATTPTGPIPPDYPGGAKALVSQAGVDPASIQPVFLTSGPGGDQFEAGATILQASLAKIGIKMTIRNVPGSQWAELYTKPD